MSWQTPSASLRPSLNHWIIRPVNWWYWETKIRYCAQVLNRKLPHRRTNHRNQKLDQHRITSDLVHHQPGASSTWLIIPHRNLFSPRELTNFNHYGDDPKWNARDSILIAGERWGPYHLLAVALQNLGNLHLVATGRSRKTASSSFMVIVHESSCRGSGGSSRGPTGPVAAALPPSCLEGRASRGHKE